jgi:hypothetical protein
MGLPEPLRWHGPRRLPAPSNLGLRWALQVLVAPYSGVESISGFAPEGADMSLELEPIAGPILLGTPRVLDPNSFVEITWLQCACPWMSLAVRVPQGLEVGSLASALTRLARRGAIILPYGASLSDAVDAVSRLFDPVPDTLGWLEYAAPRWRYDSRAKAAHQLRDGLYESAQGNAAASSRSRPTSRSKLWAQVGRALHGARAIQSSDGVPVERLRTGYHDGRSLRRALHRAFGLGIADIRGTVGWRWLLWRFLCGVGTGKSRAWDQNL